MQIFERILNAIKTAIEGPMTMAKAEQAALAAAAKKPEEKLEPLTSTVDLMKAYDLDSDVAARKQLARELDFEGEFTGTAEQNTKLHKILMERIAERCLVAPKT